MKKHHWSGIALPMLVFLVPLVQESHARTWVVAQDGSGDFPTVRQACDAASSRDSILIRPGLYHDVDPGTYLDGKPLYIVGSGVEPDGVKLDLAITFHLCDSVLVENVSFVNRRPVLIFNETSGTVRNCAVRQCVAGQWFAAIGAYGGRQVRIEDCVFEGNRNTASTNPEYCDGGAIWGTDLTIRDCLFIDNDADHDGGAVVAYNATIENCVFINNSARTGAAVSLTGYLALRNNTFLANRVTGASGGTIMMNASIPSEMNHLIVAGTVGGAAIDCQDGVAFMCCDFWNNEGGDYSGWLCGILPSYGDIWADPLFCNPEVGDVRLGAGSPCLPGVHGGVECGLMGAKGLGCDLVPVLPMSWGKLKALYR